MARQSSRPTRENNVTVLLPTPESQENRDQLVLREAKKKVAALRPRGLTPDMRKEWARVGMILASPDVDRLKIQYVDVILEYCHVLLRLRAFRAAMPALANEIYNAAAQPAGQPPRLTRNGVQIKSNPHVAQMNEAWRQWARLVGLLGLSPSDEKSMATGTGKTGDPSDRFFRR